MEGVNGLLNLKEVAKRLDIAYVTLYYNYIRPKKIKAIKLDGVYRVRERDLEEFIKSREVAIK
ncbi:hypothetical protein ES703_10953 [subsurface metagenome]